MIKYARRSHFCIDCVTKDNLATHEYSITAIVQALKKRQALAFLKITIACRTYCLPTKDLDPGFDKILEILTDLRGFGDVVYGERAYEADCVGGRKRAVMKKSLKLN